MHRVDTVGHVGNLFDDGDPSLGVNGTTVDAAILNAFQEELATAIEDAGIVLAKGTNDQLSAAIAAFIATHNAVTSPHSATSAATASRLVVRDGSGRAAFATPSASGDAATKDYVDTSAVTVSTATVTDGAGWTLSGGGAQKRAGIVYGSLSYTAGAGASWASIATLPAGYRPTPVSSVFAGRVRDQSVTTYYPALFVVSSAGVLSLLHFDDGSSYATPFAIGAGDTVDVAFSFVTA